MLFEIENFAVYSLISETLSLYSDENYINVLIYFVFNYLSFNGYYITFDSLKIKILFWHWTVEVNSYSKFL